MDLIKDDKCKHKIGAKQGRMIKCLRCGYTRTEEEVDREIAAELEAENAKLG